MTGRLNLDLDHFRARVLQDCLTEALAGYWDHRAEQFEDAAPRKGDYHGQAESDDLLDRYQRCMAIAAACRAHAQLLRDNIPAEIGPEVLDVLAEVA